MLLNVLRWTAVFLALLACVPARAQGAYPPLTTEITAEHPLFLFRVPAPGGAGGSAYAQHVIDAWGQLPEGLRPYSALCVTVPRGDEAAGFLQALQDQVVPVVLMISAGGPGGRQDLAVVEQLLGAYTTVRGIEPQGMRLEVYDAPGESDYTRANATWIAGVLETAARYGRFVHWPLAGLDAARLMAHPGYQPARAKMAALAPYLVMGSAQRGEHVAQGNAACMGLWLSNHCGAWGVGGDTAWFRDAQLLGPGQLGRARDTRPAANFYRAQILAGAMQGAWVYRFERAEDLWFSPGATAWTDVISPLLNEVVQLGLAPRKEFVLKAVPMAYELAEAADPMTFHRNLHDLSPLHDDGVLWRAAFGVGTGPIPARGGITALPLLPPGLPGDLRGQFASVVQPDDTATLEQRQAVVDAVRVLGTGDAFVAQVGRGIYVFNTNLAGQTPQAYSVPEVPAAVRGLEARREGDGVSLTWPFREGDASYTVYKRVSPQLRFVPIARGLEDRRFTDPAVPAGDTVAYAVTALTNDMEPLEGTVNYGDFLVFSVVESRIAEEAMLTPVLSTATAQAYGALQPAPLRSPSPTEGLSDAQVAMTQVIEERLVAWQRAFEAEDLSAMLGLYADEYEDPQGWRLQYVKRAYQWFFDRCVATRLRFQVRRWDFSTYDTSGQVNVILYCSLRGTALSDAAGRQADVVYELPRTESGEVLLSWTGSDGIWRIQRTDPAVPNFNELLSYSAGPYDNLRPGADVSTGR